MLVYISTFVSPHTLPLGIALTAHYRRVVFINTAELTQERRQLGYQVSDPRVEIRTLSEDPDGCRALILDARDVILAGTDFPLVQPRIAAGKPVFIAHERLFKKGLLKLLDPRTWRIAAFCLRMRKAPVYLLAIGDNSARDFRRLGFCKQNIYRFGYFPPVQIYSPEQLQKGDPHRLLWVGRFVGFKRPLMMLKAMRTMNSAYTLTMVGSGKFYAKAQAYAARHRLPVQFTGNLPPSQVAEQMLHHGILVSTSHKGEGWGAVINEGMNRGCAIVCARAIGCAGTLATGQNAVLFPTYSLRGLRKALQEATLRQAELSRAGYETVTGQFTPQFAAERFAALAQTRQHFENGICSPFF